MVAHAVSRVGPTSTSNLVARDFMRKKTDYQKPQSRPRSSLSDEIFKADATCAILITGGGDFAGCDGVGDVAAVRGAVWKLSAW
jgi:hypothetical protein